MATTLADFLVRLGVDAETAEAKEFDASLKKIAVSGKAAVKVIAKIGTVAVAAAAGITAIVKSTSDSAVAIDRQARSLSMNRQELQEYIATFKQFGADENDVSDVLNTLSDRAEDAQAGMQSFIDDFKMIGVSVQDLKGKKPQELFDLFSDKIGAMTDVTKRNAATVRLLGDDIGNKLLPMMLDGSKGIAKYRKEARELGAVMSDEQIAKSIEAQKAFARLKLVMEGLRNMIGVSFAPIIAKSTERVVEWFKANREWIKGKIDKAAEKVALAFEKIESVLDKVDERMIRLAAAIVGTGGIVWGFFKLKAILAVLGPIFTFLSGVTLVAAAKFIAIAAVITGLVLVIEDLITYLRGGPSVIGDFVKAWEDSDGILGAVVRNFKALVDVGKNVYDFLAVALPIAFEALWIVAEPVVDLLMDALSALAEIVGGVLLDALGISGDGLEDFGDWIKVLTQRLKDGKDGILDFANTARAAVQKLIDTISMAFDVMGQLPGFAANLSFDNVAQAAGSRVGNFFGGDSKITQFFTGDAAKDPATVRRATREGVGQGVKDSRQMALAQLEGGEI